jgi:hypothetical protein
MVWKGYGTHLEPFYGTILSFLVEREKPGNDTKELQSRLSFQPRTFPVKVRNSTVSANFICTAYQLGFNSERIQYIYIYSCVVPERRETISS